MRLSFLTLPAAGRDRGAAQAGFSRLMWVVDQGDCTAAIRFINTSFPLSVQWIDLVIAMLFLSAWYALLAMQPYKVAQQTRTEQAWNTKGLHNLKTPLKRNLTPPQGPNSNGI